MPPARGAPKAAQSASALERVGANGASESLQNFLGGFVANSNSTNNNHGSSTASADAQQEALIAQSLRLVQKSSDISKQKALQQIMQSVDALSEASVALYAAAIAEVVIQYANYSNPLIRAMIFGLLRRVGSRDKTVKVQLMSSLPTLCGVWIMAMHDMESAVRQEATAAFEATFSPDKRPVVLQKYAEEIRRCACEAVEKTMEEGKPLKDDALDPRANATYAALRTLGYLIRQVSASQTTLLPYILDQTFLLQLLPPATTAEASTTTKSAMAKKPPPYLAAMTPLVRSAALSLLRDVVSVCPLTPKIHSLIAQALRSTVVEVHVSVAARFWELLLLWCKSSVAEVITYLPGGLLDEIVDGMMNCNDPELADIIFPSILPLLTQLSKDNRCDTVVDEFCGALVEKLRSLIDTPNVSARELGVVLTTLLQCWELLCLRRKESSSVDGEELFAVVLYNLSLLMQLEAKQRRFMNVVRRDLSRSLLKTSLRCEPIFQRCLATLCELPDRPFSALPPERDASLARSLRCIMAATLGTLYASAVEEGTYTRQLPQYAQLLNAALDVQCGRPVESDGLEVMEMLLANAGTSFIPAEVVQTKMVEHMLARLDVAEPVVAEDESVTAHTTPFRQLALTALSWGNATIRERLQNVQAEVVQRAVRDHFLLDPQTVGNVLIAACRVADFAVIDQSIHALRTSNATLSEEERAEAVLAIASSLEVDLELLGAHPTRCPVVAAMMDDVDEESSDAGSSEEDEESDDDDDDDDETESEGSSNNSADEQQRSKEKEEEVLHTSTEVASRLQQWIRALQSGHNLCDVLALTPEVVEQRLMPWLTLMIAALAPAVKPDQLLSLKGLRVALMSSSRDALTSAMEAKSAVVKTHDFAVMVEELHAMLQSLRVVPAAEDACSTNVLTAQMEGRLPSCFHAIHALHQLAPLASSEVWRAWMSTPDTWTLWAPSPLDLHRDDPAFLPLFDGVLPISRLRTGLGRNVRTAQCIKLMDHCNMMESEEHIRRNFPGGVAKLLHLLLRVFSAKEMLAEAVERCLLHQLLLPLFLMVKREDAEELLEHLASTDGASNTCSELHLIITLAATVVELATIVAATAADDRHESAATAAQHRMAFCLCARRIMSAVVCRAVSELFGPGGALGISVERSTLYANFCSTMDKAATIMKENLLAQLPQEVERLLLEGSCMLSQWDARTSRLTIILHRHLGSMPVVAISTVKSFLPYAQRQPPTVGLELLAELSCTRILDMPVFSELMRIILNSMSQCYTLRHLPSNKRLMEENVDRPSRPLTFDELRTVSTAAILAWRGSVIHSRMDDVLRASVNLLVFDTICEAVSRLRTTTEEEAPLLAKLIATNVGFMEELLTKDVSVFRASEVSVTKIAKVATYAYAWVSATPVQRLEAIGMDVVAGVLRCVNMLSHLTLMNANVASLRGGMRAIMGKCSLRGVRETFSGTPAKLATFRKQQRLITKTQKQRLLLFPYLLAWSIYLSASTEETEAAHTTTTNSHVELAEEEVLKLLDLLCVLLLSPMYVSSTPRLSDTFLGHCAEVEPRVSERHAAGVLTTSLGFEIIALTRTTSTEVMSELAKGAAAVFAKLLTNRESLPHVRRWLDTVERKLHALFFQMVEHYISPTLVQESLLAVCRHGDGASSFSISDSCSIQVSLAKQQIDLTYEMDDAKSEVRIIFPSAFPLRRPTVDSSNGRGCGVKNDRWRSWMLRMTAMLFSDSANMWQCVELFARNLDAHFEGTEPCPICFAIVSSIGRSLPDLQCATCKNCRLHSACLQRWWSSGAGQSICPLCRAPWIAA